MGSPVSPIIANLFMENFESLALSSFPSTLKFYGRYYDDAMCILKRSDVDNVTEHLNSIHPAIEFTFEYEQDNKIAMLDTLIHKNQDGCLSFSVYRKSTHTDQYLHFESHHPLEHKLGVIRTLKHRAMHPAIEFTFEYEQDNKIAMLDTLIHKNQDGSLSFSVYRKSTHTDQYLHFESHQPLEHKLGVIRTLKRRAMHPAIEFTVEYEQDNKIAMLDTLIHKNQDGSLSFSVYRKSTHTDQYLHFESHQPLEHKLGVICTLKRRANTISSNQDFLGQELSHIQQALSVCGYTKWVWQSSASNKITPRPRSQNTTPVGSISLPYIQGATEALSCTIRKVGVQVHAKSTNTIGSMLVSPKNKPKKCDRSCVIYGLTCSNCPSQYVGKTERPLKHRISEHKKDSSPLEPTLKLRITSSPRMLRFWTLNPDISNVASRRPTTLQLWSQTSIRTRPIQLAPIYSLVIKSCDRGSSRRSHD